MVFESDGVRLRRIKDDGLNATETFIKPTETVLLFQADDKTPRSMFNALKEEVPNQSSKPFTNGIEKKTEEVGHFSN